MGLTMKSGEISIYDKIVDLARRRGIFWTSFEIYGGVAGFYDYGPVGVLIKRNIMQTWLKFFVYTKNNVVEIETPIVSPRVVFKASGHEEHFTDPVLVCNKCGRVYRADHLVKEMLGLNVEGWPLQEITRLVNERGLKCPECGGNFDQAFNALLLFSTQIGPYRGEPAYLRPEHAQGMFINFPFLFKILRSTLPLGIAQVGKVLRNEISPRQGLLRLREFTIIEIEFFFDPDKAREEVEEVIGEVEDESVRVVTKDLRLKGVEEPLEFTVRELIERGVVKTPWLAYWMGVGNKFVKHLGIPHDKIRFIEKLDHERAHYSAQTFDQEVYTEKFGWVEVAGYAYRTSYDIERHMQESGVDFTVFKRYEEPQVVKVEKAIPIPNELMKELKDPELFKKVMSAITSRSPEDVAKELREKGFIEVEGVRLPVSLFSIKVEEVKISGVRILPHVVEPSFGLERLLYVVLEYSYSERDGKVVLKIPAHLAPYHVAVFPLVTGKKPEHARMVEIARSIHKLLVELGFRSIYDEEGSIGRRYARADEIGIPYTITVDYQTLEDNTVTVRDRDTTQQVRVKIEELGKYLASKFKLDQLL
jgi:glycyl-tRNA synthetase